MLHDEVYLGVSHTSIFVRMRHSDAVGVEVGVGRVGIGKRYY